MNPVRTTISINPPHLTAGLMTSTSNAPRVNVGARDRAQSWRGKYLRALNINPDKEPTKDNSDSSKNKLRSMSFHRTDANDRNSMSRSYSSSTEKEDEERKSLERLSQHDSPSPSQHHRIQAVPLRIPSRPSTQSQQSINSYGFVARPGLARGRRCHTDPFLYDERVSAPIQIPSASAVVNQLDGNMRRDVYTSGGQRLTHASPLSLQRGSSSSHNPVPLMSWEEPVAMLAAADAVSRGWKMSPSDNLTMELGLRRERTSNNSNNNQEFTEPMDEDDDEEDDDDDDHHIFAMEGLHESDDESRANHSNNSNQKNGKSRRRLRTESLNIISSGREKRVHHAFGGDAYTATDLSKSFVPPHQLVERDCFSIGMRDELRRRPANNI